MNKATSNAAILAISLDRTSRETLQAQLTRALRRLVNERRLRPGDRLPSSRALARELSVSRVTVTAVYDQLIAEGFVEGRRGSGAYITADLPDLPDRAPRDAARSGARALRPPERVPPFENAFPDLREFPHREWARLFDRLWRSPDPALLGAADPLGWGPLRVAIAHHLHDWRGITCAPEQVVVTSGLVEAVELISTVLAPGSRVLVEEPGYHVLRRVLRECGLVDEPVAVDEHGFDIGSAPHAASASAVAVTPSRQFPLGMTLPLARRIELLNWASTTGGYLLEDDFDGEYRYRGQPLPAMMSLDDQGRVIYVGSFSKVMFPGLRLGFIVLPGPLVEPVSRRLRWTGPRASLVAQPVLARFIEEGSFATHLRRMRRLHAERQRVLVASVRESAKGLLEIEPSAGGMHLVAWFAPEFRAACTDADIAAASASEGLRVRALSSFYAGPAARQGLVLGYAGFDADEIRDGAQRLAAMISRRLGNVNVGDR